VPAAKATCASIFGIGNSADCTSEFSTIAVALGPNAKATAKGILGAAVAIGTGARTMTYGNGSLSVAAGPNERAFFLRDPVRRARRRSRGRVHLRLG
jgi:hypothetical protein